MKREAFKMYLKPGCEAEYEKRHAAIWPELKQLLSNILFASQKTNGESWWRDTGANPIVQKWWDYMADIMEVNPDNSPVTVQLLEVFYMD